MIEKCRKSGTSTNKFEIKHYTIIKNLNQLYLPLLNYLQSRCIVWYIALRMEEQRQPIVQHTFDGTIQGVSYSKLNLLTYT